jgi:diguanylate cyclase (GGDEF)-like protein
MARRFSDSLLLRFSVLSTVLLCVLGVGVVAVLRDEVVRQAMDAAEDKALTVARVGIEQHVTEAGLAAMTPAELDRFDRLVREERVATTGVRRIKIFNDVPRIVYSDDRTQIGRSGTAPVRAALAGDVGSKQTVGTSHSGSGERMLEVFVPVRERRNGRAIGVLEVYLPYEPVAAEISKVTRRLYVAVLAGLLLLWLGLFRIVSRASRTLRAQARELRHQARHDALTGLANRTLLEERLRHALARGRREGERVAVLLLDLDEFKTVNDSLGHAAGDALLAVVAQRLREAVRASDTVARLGGDEFAVLLEEPGDLDAVTELAQRLLAALAQPVHLASRQVYPHASVGIALSDPLSGESSDDEAQAVALLRGADMAMYAAKGEGKHRAEIFAPHMHTAALERLERKAELQRALDREELRLHFQPIVNLATGEIEGAEALVRWQHPARGLLPPAEFIALAEETSLIVPLGAWVLRQACHQAARWLEEFPDHPDRYVSVNVAGHQLERAQFLDEVQHALAAARLPAGCLMLEVTESSLLEDTNSNARRLQALRGLGVRLAVDDFGTGYSALNYLRRFRMDVLKIDRAFIDGVDSPSEQSALVDAILTMARALDLRVVAEGIEENPQLAHLRERGCPLGQGFLLARPVTGADLTALLAQQPHEAGSLVT